MDKYFWLKIGVNFFELLAFAAGLIYWKKVRINYWKWFVVYLGVILATELSAKYLNYKLHQSTSDIYFFFGIPIQFLFFYWLFYKNIFRDKRHWLPIVFVVIYLIAWVADLIFFRFGKYSFSSFSYTVGNLLLLVLIIVYFLRLMSSNAILTYKTHRMFWVCLGLLLFYLGAFPFYSLRNTLYYSYPSIFYIYWNVSFALNSLMYLSFTAAFIWGNPK